MTPIELKDLIRKGETSTVQFKRTFRAAEDIANELVAFANSKGGKLIIGIDDATGKIVGLDYSELQKIGSLIGNAANDKVKPPIYPEVETIDIDGEKVMVVDIRKGKDAPYKNYKGEMYVKQGPDKRRVTDNQEILRMFYESDTYQPDRAPINGTSIEDIDMVRLEEFFKKYYHTSLQDFEMPIEKVLRNLDIIDESGRLSMAGLLFFGKSPRFRCEWFMIKAVWFYGDSIGETEYRDSRDIIGTVPYMFEKGMDFLDSVLHHVQDGQNFNSVGVLEIPETALREILQNALIHRSWLTPAPIRLLVFSDRVEIISPGALPNNLTVDDIKLGNAYQRNQLAATLCAKTMEYRGLGSGIVRALRADSDIEFHNEENGDQFRVILWRKLRNQYADKVYEEAFPYPRTVKGTDSYSLPSARKEDARQRKTRKDDLKQQILECIRSDSKLSMGAIASRLNVSPSTIAKHIRVLRESGALRRIGPDKGGHWEVAE